MNKHLISLALIITTVFYSCDSVEYTSVDLPISFNKLSNAIRFSNDLTETPNNNILNYDAFYGGGGVAVADFNNDNFPDIFLTGNQVNSALYLNNGNLSFQELDIPVLKEKNRWSTGASVVDINQDGWMDIYICNSGPDFTTGKRRNQLLINQNGNGFTEEASAYGIDDDSGSTMASFFDMDKDGDLDLFLINSAQFHKLAISDYDRLEEALKNESYDHLPSFHSQSSHLYENRDGQFIDITETAGMLRLGYGLGLITKDFNNDGWTDVYVANDYHIPDILYINQKNGTFKDEIKQRMRHVPFFSMGCDYEDINLDGAPDLITLDMAPIGHYRSKTLMSSMSTSTFYYLVNQKEYHHQYMFNSLQLNNKSGYYKDIGLYAGVAKSEWSWAALLNDFDLDGYNDLFITNGFKRDTKSNDWKIGLENLQSKNVTPEAEFEHLKTAPSEKTLNYMFKNNGDLTFKQSNEEWGMTEATFSNGAIYTDLDLDGDMDLVVNNVDEEVHIYQNNAADLSVNHHIKIKLIKGDRINPIEAINAKIDLYIDDKHWYKEWHPVSGFQSSQQSDYMVFGLGSHDEIDSIVVSWNTGRQYDRQSRLLNVNTNQLLTVDFANSTSSTKNSNPPKALFTNARRDQTNLNFLHREDNFDDFAVETLLPHRMSQLGPFISQGDANTDGESDFFIGGATGQSGAMFVQLNGTFYATQGLPWEQHAQYEDMGSLWFDADQDGDQDLYVVSGGTTINVNDVQLFQDRLYLNQGNTFADATNQLPRITASGSKVVGSDFDKDGDIDLFVAGRHQPLQYPRSPQSYLLVNDKGYFKDMTLEIGGEELQQAGMVTDAVWVDIDNDSDKDLVLVGEWTGITIFELDNGKLTKQNNNLTELTGFWQSITTVDLDHDGDLDFIIGNVGKNTKFKASKESPFKIRAADFDKNNTNDIVLSTWESGKELPVRGRQCSSEQMPFIADKFPSYDAFAKATIGDILQDISNTEIVELEVVTFAHHMLINNGDGTFASQELWPETQLAPLNAVVANDLNSDGLTDLVIAGNMYQTEVETPRYDSGTGQIFINKGGLNFEELDIYESGLYLPMDVKDLQLLSSSTGSSLLVANNNNYLQCYKSIN